MSETFTSHELHTPLSSQMLSDPHLCDTNGITVIAHKGEDDSRSSKNYTRGKIPHVNISNSSSLTSLSPFMSALELSPFLTSPESSLSLDYVWHEENVPRFDCAAPEFHNVWKVNKQAGIIPVTDSEGVDHYNVIPQFDGTSDESSSSHPKPSQNHIPPVESQLTDCLQSSRAASEHLSSRSNSDTEHPFGMSGNSATTRRRTGNSEICSSGKRTLHDVRQTGPQQQRHQQFQHHHKMPTLLPLSPAGSIQSPTHNLQVSPRQQAIPTPSPPHLQPQSPAYCSALTSKSYQHPYQSPSQYPYQSPQSSWGFHSPHQPYKSPSANQSYQSPSASQSYQSPGETSESSQSDKSDKSPAGGEPQSAGFLYKSPCSSHQLSHRKMYQAGRDQKQSSSYQSQLHEGFQPQRYPHTYHIPRGNACDDPDHSVWGPCSYSTNSPELLDTHSLKSCQNSASSAAKSHVKVHYSSDDLQADTSECQSDSQDCMSVQDLGNKPSVIRPFSQSSFTGLAHISEQKLNPSLCHPSQQPSNGSSVNLGNIDVSSKVSTETAGILSSTLKSEQYLKEEPGQIHTRRDQQTAFIKKVIDSPTPPMPGRSYRRRVEQGVELLGRSRSTSLSSPISPGTEPHRCPSQPNVNVPGPGQTASHLTEPRVSSPMHSSDWQVWKEQNFPPGCQWQRWKMHERQSVDGTGILVDNSVELDTSTASVGVRLPHASSTTSSVPSCYENRLQLNVPHVDSDVLQERKLSSTVSIRFSNLNDSRDTAHIPILPGTSTKMGSIKVGIPYRRESEGASSEPAEKLDSTDLDCFSYLKPENISRCNSLDSIHLQDEKEDMNKECLDETSSPNVGTSRCDAGPSAAYTIAYQIPTMSSKNMSHCSSGDIRTDNVGTSRCDAGPSAAYTIAYQIPTMNSKNMSHCSSGDIRTDNVEVVRMRPGDVHSNSLMKIGCEVVKAVKLNEVDLEGCAGGELSPSGIIPLAQSEIDVPVVGAHEHRSLNDKETAAFLTYNTSFQQNTTPCQKRLKTGQTDAPLSRASPEANYLSPVDSEWMHDSSDKYLTNKQKIKNGFTQSDDSHLESFPSGNKLEGATSLHEMSSESRHRQFNSQPPNPENLVHQISTTQDSSCVHSVPLSIEDKCQARQEEDLCQIYLHHQKQRNECHHHQSRACLQQLSSPGVNLHPTNQHKLFCRCESETLSGNTCDEDRQNNQNIFNSSRFDLQLNSACSNNHVTGRQHGDRLTLKPSVLGHMPSARHESRSANSTYRDLHAAHSSDTDKLDDTHVDNDSSSSQIGWEEDSVVDMAHNSCFSNDVSEQQKMKLSSRKNVKALCLTIPKPRSHVKPLDRNRKHMSSEDAKQSSSFCCQTELGHSESDSRDKFSFRKSKRCSRLEDLKMYAEGKDSPQNAKVQSGCSKSSHILKLKKRKTADSLIEGVHYMVVGKFKGHKEMRVKTKKLNMTPVERVKAEDFEKLAAKEVVRVLSPVSLLESRKHAGDSEARTHPCDISESESEMDSNSPHVIGNNSSIDFPPASLPEAGMAVSKLAAVNHEFKPDRFRNGTESKNIFASFSKESSDDDEWSRCVKEDSKNIFTNMMKGIDEKNKWSRRLKEDHFFFRFKESFIKHCKGKEDVVSDSQLQDHENIFFEGVKKSSFCSFQQKFLSNIQKLKSGDYSSSSDDEDDVLDETILKKIGLSHGPDISQVDNRITPLRLVKIGSSTGERNLWNQYPEVQAAVCKFSDQNNKNRHYLVSDGTAGNGQEKSCDSKLGSYRAKDTDIDAQNEEGRYNEQSNKCTSWIDRFQEGVKTEDRQLMKGYEREKCIGSTFKGNESEKCIGGTLKGYESEKCIGRTLKEYERKKCIGSTWKAYERERCIGSALKGYESEKCIGSTLKGYESEKCIGSTLKGYENEKCIGSTLKAYEREKCIGSTLKGYEKYIDSSVNMESTSSSAEIKVGQSRIYQDAYPENSIISNGTHNEDIKEDYLKCQMAFFEDISSDSESNDTIIMDNCLGKGNTLQRDTTALYSSFSVVDSRADRLSETHISSQKSTLPIVSDQFNLPKHDEHGSQRYDSMQQVAVSASVHGEAGICVTGNGLVSESSDHKLTPVCTPSADFTQVFGLTNHQKETSAVDENNLTLTEIVHKPQDSFVEHGQGFPTSMGDSDAEVEVDKSRVTHSNEIGIMNKVAESECMLFTKTHHKKKRHRKPVKKMKQAEVRSGSKGRRVIEDDNSSCQDEIVGSAQPDCPSKSLPERKKTYTYYTEDLDSDGDVSSNSSDEDFTVGSSRRKGLKSHKSKGRNSEEKLIRKIPKINADPGRATKRGQKTSSSRGKKRKVAGGDKLLSSLSLLHMATLANLTETPSDLTDNQSASEATIYLQDDSFYYTDNSLSSAPDEMFSQYSKEEDPAIVDNRLWKHSRKRKCVRENTTLSKKLLKRQTNLKYGHSLASDIGRNSASLSRLVNSFSSSSPVPSNFTFSQISDASNLPEAANLCDDASTSSTLQLLETRRAQVNCASFSMKDILRLATPDDSMDSDSRDSSAHMRFSVTKKAQVKSTALSMSDILKLTNVESHSETGQIPTSGHVLLSNADPLLSQPAGNCIDLLDSSVSDPISALSHPDSPVSRPNSAVSHTNSAVSHFSSQASTAAVVTSCAVQPMSVHFVSSASRTQTETSQPPAFIRSQLKQFDSGSCQLYDDTESSKVDSPLSANSHKPVTEKYRESSTEPVTCVLPEDGTSWGKPHNKSVSDSDLLQGDNVEQISNAGSKVKMLDTAWWLGNKNSKFSQNDSSEFEACVNKPVEEPHKKVSISSSRSAFTSLSVLSTDDVKPACETLSTPSVFSNIVNETGTTSCSTLPHSSRSVLKMSHTSPDHKDGQEEDSESGIGSHRVGFTATTGTDSEVTGASSPSLSPLEELDKLNCETAATIPSQIVLEASDPDTSTSSVVKTARLSGATGRAVCSQKVNCSSSEPSSASLKQENKGNHQNMNVRNTDRGVKPLHPLQIPHYSLAGQNCPPQVEQVVHNTKNSSLYYPHCWQWPVHTPGSDATVSPLNLCTSHKSPNNYSPITPTSPVSPDYPTQAQGVTEFDRSPRVKEGKPLWYPWLKAEPDRPDTRVTSAQSSLYSSEDYKTQSLRNTKVLDLLPVKQDEQQEAANVFREPAQVESHRVKPDVNTTSDLQKYSASKSKVESSTTSKSTFVKPCGALVNTESAVAPGTVIDPSSVTVGSSLPSTSCLET